MRTPSAVSPDGQANLLAAFRVAADPTARGRGVLVVLNDQINSARDVTKSDALRLHTFVSRAAGPLGVVDADRVVFRRRIDSRHTARSEFDVFGIEALPRVLAGASQPQPQRDALATLAPKITKSEARLDWREPAQALERRVRAFDPWPIAETHLSDGRRLRVFEAAVVAADRPDAPGTIVAAGRAGIDVATGDGVLRLLKIQPPSGRVMDAEAYLAAHSLSGAEFVG